MYITDLFRDESSTLRYTYFFRNSEKHIFPTSPGERADGPWFDRGDGKLFEGQIGYSGYSVLDRGVDLALDLGGRYFLDHLTMTLAPNSQIDGLDVIDGDGRLVGRAVSAETNFGREFTISLGCFAERLTLRIHTVFADFDIMSISLPAATGIEESVYPLPTKATYGEGILPFSAITGITVDEPAAGAATYLSERLSDELSVTLPTGEGNIRFFCATREDDGYTLSVGADGVTVTAGCTRGFFYAAASLIQLAREGGFCYAEIDDSPMMALRGAHLPLPRYDQIPFVYRLVREILVPMRYNFIIFELAGAMEYKCHPEINETWLEAGRRTKAGEWPRMPHHGFVGEDILTHETIRDICAYVRSFGLEVVPEVQSLSHVQYLTKTYPEMAEEKPKTVEEEIDHAKADIKPNEFYKHNLCPRHPKYYDLIFSLIDEIVEVIRPERFVHIGHDEGYDLGTCPICAGHAAEIFAEEVTRLHDHIAGLGLETMMWSDMIHPGTDNYLVPEAAKDIPRDILMLDFTWYFSLARDIEDELLPYGFPVAIGNMYSSHFPRYETRSKKPGMVGAQVSTWQRNTEEACGRSGKMFDFVFTATMMWNPDYDSTCRLTYTELVKKFLPGMRRRIGELPSVEISAIDIGGDLRSVPAELLFKIPAESAIRLSGEKNEAVIPVGKKAELLEFLHATDRTSYRPIWEAPIKIGEYVLVYADGSEHSVPVEYSANIMTYHHRYGTPIPSQYYRHSGYAGTYLAFPVEGKDAEGRDYTLLRYPVKNPHPDKEIAKIVCRHAGSTDAEILLFEVKM